MAFDKKLLEILACPICKSQLIFNKELNELVCKADKLAYAIKDDIPVMLENEARQLTLEELEQIK
ncbi:Trm112 family protein [Psychrosphaera sp. F3M07]|jgi:uncharacterized protein YbaR (Trm112 family)|uniref:UPF0434 protein RT723_17235 n=1 Tax=Psychrosphaera aquimarina TaxID=2044854 RepID=A0ABU3R5E9_9GAMM|nr:MULTISPECIES: Trm112 family protein [Psychrosphaera]MBU2916516.1 Trm112 family protein [Psychrosphaera sp. F3M07]MDU0114702.1 Trm112 family protein [Psychrosphaera aquimarina]